MKSYEGFDQPTWTRLDNAWFGACEAVGQWQDDKARARRRHVEPSMVLASKVEDWVIHLAVVLEAAVEEVVDEATVAWFRS